MGTPGKVLAILNALAAALFVYLAAGDWGKRQQWAYAAVRMDEAVRGIPIDQQEKDLSELTPLVVLYKESTPAQLQPTGAATVATQEDEVRLVHDELKKQIEDTRAEDARTAIAGELKQLPNPFRQRVQFAALVLPITKTPPERVALAGRIFNTTTPVLGKGGLLEQFFSGPDMDLKAQKARLAQALLPLTRTAGERQTVAKTIADAKKIDDLMADDGPFETAFKAPLGQPAGKDNYSGKRAAIAHLLVNLGRDPQELGKWYSRVVAVVGFRAFARAANDQAKAFRDMAAQVQLATAGDLNNFLMQHRAVMTVLHDLDERYRLRSTELAQHQAQQQQLDTLVKERQGERDQYEKDLAKARENLKEALARQNQEATMLATWQNQIKERQQANEALLRKIHDLEKLGQ